MARLLSLSCQNEEDYEKKLVWTAGVSAQSWSLDDCMKYAVEHATEVKREVVNARQRKQDYQHAVAGFLPTVTGGVQGQYAWGRNIDPETNTYNNVTTLNARQRKQDYQHAVAGFLPTVTGGVQGQYAWGRNIDPETNTYNNVTTFNNYYQLYAELNVFDGFATINALKQAKLRRDYSATAMQKMQDDRAIDVMQNYVDAAYAEARIQIASEKLNESKRMLAKMKRDSKRETERKQADAGEDEASV